MSPRSRTQIQRDHEKARLKKELAQQAEKDLLAKERKAKNVEIHRKNEMVGYRRKLRAIAGEAAQLSRWRQWVRSYNSNLLDEGFTLSGGFWNKTLDGQDGDDAVGVVRFKQVIATRLSDIQPMFPKDPEAPNYEYVSWREIQYQHVWFSQREQNLLDLGFKKREGWVFTSWSSNYNWNGLFSFRGLNFPATVWDWPGALDNERLGQAIPPTDRSPYQTLDLTAVDDTLLQGSNKCYYEKDLDRLPSATLGDLKDHRRRLRRFDAPEKKSKSSEPPSLGLPSRLAAARYGMSWRYHKNIGTPEREPMWRELLIRPRIRTTTRILLPQKGSRCAEGYPFWQCHENIVINRWPIHDYYHMKALHEKVDRFWRLCQRGCSWLDHVVPYRWSRRSVRYFFWDWDPPPQALKKEVYEVNGFLNGQAETAFPDTGSDQNLLSLDYVLRNNIAITTSQRGETEIRTADGRWIPTIGYAELLWSFGDSKSDRHKLVFHVLEHCVHDVLLGHHFLFQTNTTTSNRIKRRTVYTSSTSSAGAVYDIHAASGLRSHQCMINGRIAGKDVAALADTGAQVNIMSLDFAQVMGLKLNMTGHRGIFRFIDGTEAPSIASVNTMWTSSDNKQYNLKFEVLIGSSYDVILGQKHIYATKVLDKKFDNLIPSTHSRRPFSSTPTNSELVALTSHSQRGSCHTDERFDTKPPDTDPAEESNVCAVGFRSPFAKAIKKAKSLRSKSHGDENPIPHLAQEVQEEINRRAAAEASISRLPHGKAHLPDSSTVVTTTSDDLTDSILMPGITDDSVSTAPSASNTSTDFQPFPTQAPSRPVNNEVASKVEITSLSYLDYIPKVNTLFYTYDYLITSINTYISG